MKKRYLTLSPILILLMLVITTIAQAQVTVGPSDATSPPPTSAADVAKIVCYGSAISMSGPQDGGVDFAKYHWYKIDPSGTRQEVTTITGRTYTEASAAAGYYNYQVVTENTNGCISPISDVFKIFVLPQLNVTITTPTSSMCAVATNATLLTANPTPATGYALDYQWTKNGVDIPGANTNTYNVTGETTAATITFGVKVTYALNATCPATTTKDIILTPIPTKPMITAN
jgi:hypothetical protein